MQIGDAQILPSFDSAYVEISRVMQKMRQSKHDKPSQSDMRPFLEAIRNPSSSVTAVSDESVDVNRAIIVHIYSPLVPTLNLVDLPGLLPASCVEQNSESSKESSTKARPPVSRSNSGSSLRTNANKRGSHGNISNTLSKLFTQDSNQRRSSFSHRQTWQSSTAAEQRLEIVERYILSYPDSLYLLFSDAKDTETETNNSSMIKNIIDPSLVELVQHYDLQVSR